MRLKIRTVSQTLMVYFLGYKYEFLCFIQITLSKIERLLTMTLELLKPCFILVQNEHPFPTVHKAVIMEIPNLAGCPVKVGYILKESKKAVVKVALIRASHIFVSLTALKIILKTDSVRVLTQLEEDFPPVDKLQTRDNPTVTPLVIENKLRDTEYL